MRLRGNLRRAEGGFTMIELLIVLAILAALLAIAVPSYLGFKERAATSTAQANIRQAMPAVEAYFSDHDTYVGLDDPVTGLPAYNAGISSHVTVNPADLSDTHYCLKSVKNQATAWVYGPGGQIVDTQPAQCT